MIRKLLVVAAAVAIPASALAAVATVGTSGVAGALPMKTKTYTTMSCAISGSVTFAKPGLSYNGSLSKASTSKAKSAATETGTGCGKISATDPTGTTNVTKNTITSASTDCNTATPPLPGACSGETLTKFYAYDTASSLASSGVSSIVTSLGPTGIKAVDNNNGVVGDVTEGGTSAVDPGGACGSNVGFQLSGNTNISGLTYDLLLCITGDTGTTGPDTSGTTGSFYNDYIAAASGNAGITIATGIYGGASELSFTYTP
jgi:hypothetical protein